MKFFVKATIVAAALVIGSSSPAIADTPITVVEQKSNTGWFEAKTSHFSVYGQMSYDEIRRYAEELERYDGALRQIVGGTTTTPVSVYVVDTFGDVQKLGGITGIAGFYNAAAQGAFAVTPRQSVVRNDFKFTARQILFHEYAHHILLSSANDLLPGWMTEGAAEFFGTATIGKDGSVTFGAVPQARGFSIAGMNHWSVPDLLNSDKRKMSQEESEQRYSRGWLAYHYLMLNVERKGQLPSFVKLINSGVDPLDAGKQAFGDLKKLDTELDRYLHRSTFPGLTFVPTALKDGVNVDIRPLRQGEADMMPYRMISTVGVSEERAKTLLKSSRPVAAKYPGDAWVQRTITKMEYDARNWKEAEAAADQTLALEPENVMALLYKGRVHGQLAYPTKDVAEWKTARALFLKANRIEPDYALPFVLYYDSFGAAGQKANESAVNGLLRAAVLVPEDLSIFIRIGLLRISDGDQVGAAKIFNRLAANPEAGGLADSARKVAEKLDAKASSEDITAAIKEANFDIVNEFTPPEVVKERAKKGKDGKKDKDGK